MSPLSDPKHMALHEMADTLSLFVCGLINLHHKYCAASALERIRDAERLPWWLVAYACVQRGEWGAPCRG